MSNLDEFSANRSVNYESPIASRQTANLNDDVNELLKNIEVLETVAAKLSETLKPIYVDRTHPDVNSNKDTGRARCDLSVKISECQSRIYTVQSKLSQLLSGVEL